MDMKINGNALEVGLIKGRHEMPVDKYIIEKEIADVFDFTSISEQIKQFLIENCNLRVEVDCPIDAYCDTECHRGDALKVYVTGLTAVTAELIKLCAINGVKLTLMHYNSATGDYVPQIIF